jgi:hypothetical protein
MVEAQVSAGIVMLGAADWNIPEADCCGEAVEGRRYLVEGGGKPVISLSC